MVSNLEMALKNKDKLVNFTPEDFLNDFQKETVVSNPTEDKEKAKQENAEDEFVFCVLLIKSIKKFSFVA